MTRSHADIAALGRAVRERRASLSLSLRALADELNVPHTTIHRLEQGKEVGGTVVLRLVIWMQPVNWMPLDVAEIRRAAFSEAIDTLRIVREMGATEDG